MLARKALIAVVCAVLIAGTLPLVALAYDDGLIYDHAALNFLPFTESPTLHPDRVDEINARAYLPYTEVPTLHPDRVDEINARAYLPYTEAPTLHPDRLDEIRDRMRTHNYVE